MGLLENGLHHILHIMLHLGEFIEASTLLPVSFLRCQLSCQLRRIDLYRGWGLNKWPVLDIEFYFLFSLEGDLRAAIFPLTEDRTSQHVCNIDFRFLLLFSILFGRLDVLLEFFCIVQGCWVVRLLALRHLVKGLPLVKCLKLGVEPLDIFFVLWALFLLG